MDQSSYLTSMAFINFERLLEILKAFKDDMFQKIPQLYNFYRSHQRNATKKEVLRDLTI